ncbi:hypothetical protein [Actinoplanes sp. NPDC026619]|uniref:hypothetical protein n=1 Tax=Actinoplanes sp. NPDC026619 TaxID=3155798 RepID=UPI00340551EE
MPIIEFVVAVTSDVAAGTVTSLLRKLLAVQEDQAQQIAGLRTDLRRLLEGPWRRSQTATEDAIAAAGPRRRQLQVKGNAAAFRARS